MKKPLLFAASLLAIVLFPSLLNSQSAGQNPSLVMYRYNSFPTQPGPVLQGDQLGAVNWKGLTAIGSVMTGASIQSTITGPVSAGFLPANMVFRTGAPDLQNRMIITTDGLVGVGIMTPQYHLDILGNTHTSGDFFGRIHMDANAGDQGPDTYLSEAYFENKTGTELSAPNASRGGLLTLAPTGNTAGNRDHQLFFNDGGIFYRFGQANLGAWDPAWTKLLTGADINGTTNRIAKFTGTNSLGDSRLFDNGTRIGINNFTPAYDFDVNAESNFSQRVKIGAANFATGYLLSVGGGIMAEEVRVQMQPWPDYVFDENYSLMPLREVEKFTKENRHLPGIAPAKTVETEGLDLGAMQKAQMEKIEELFLHLIAVEKRIAELEKQNLQLQQENAALKAAARQ